MSIIVAESVLVQAIICIKTALSGGNSPRLYVPVHRPMGRPSSNLLRFASLKLQQQEYSVVSAERRSHRYASAQFGVRKLRD